MRIARNVLLAVAVGGLSLLATTNASADTVVLKDGKRLEGKVKIQELGKYVVLELPTGVQKTVIWDDIKEIEVATPTPAVKEEPQPPPKPAAEEPPKEAPAPAKPKFKKKLDKTQMDAKADKDGASASVVHDCGDGDPACHEEATVKLKNGEFAATYNAEEDCSSEDAEVCTKKTNASAGKDGLSLGITKESAKRVTGPKTGSTGFGLLANFLYGSGESFSMTGFTAGVNMRIITGGLFPGPKGGGWFGFFIEPNAQFSYSSTKTETKEVCAGGTCYGGDTKQSSSGAVMLNASAGIQWMRFGAQDQKNLQQKGFGLAAGGQLGVYIPMNEGEATKTYGLSASILMPNYNPGTGTFVNEQINVFILPTSEIFFLLIGAQKTWG